LIGLRAAVNETRKVRAIAPGMQDRRFGRVIFILSNTFWSPPGAHMLAYIASRVP
jgi:hypothetical protein